MTPTQERDDATAVIERILGAVESAAHAREPMAAAPKPIRISAIQSSRISASDLSCGPSPNRSSQRPRTLLAYAVLIAAMIWFYWPSATGTVGLTPDAIKYLECARQLVEGQPLTPQTAALMPGLPLLLAGLSQISPEPWRSVPAIHAALAILTVLATCRLARGVAGDGRTPLAAPSEKEGKGRYLFAALAVLVAMSPLIQDQAVFLCTEMPYLLALVMALDASVRVLRITRSTIHGEDVAPTPAASARHGYGAWGWMGIWTALACLLRPTGVLLIPAVLLCVLLRRWSHRDRIVRARRVEHDLFQETSAPFQEMSESSASLNERIRFLSVATYLVVALAPLLLWRAWAAPYATAGGYGAEFAGSGSASQSAPGMAEMLGERVLQYGSLRLHELSQIALPARIAWSLHQPPLADWTAWLCGGGLLILLMARLIREKSPVEAYILMHLAILAVWPWNEGPRFVMPLVPLIWVAVIASTAGISGLARAALSIVIVGLILLQAADSFIGRDRLPRRQAAFAALDQEGRRTGRWLKSHLPAGPTAWWLLLPNGDGRKLTWAWGAYLSRRPGHFDDLPAPDRSNAAPVDHFEETLGARVEAGCRWLVTTPELSRELTASALTGSGTRICGLVALKISSPSAVPAGD